MTTPRLAAWAGEIAPRLSLTACIVLYVALTEELEGKANLRPVDLAGISPERLEAAFAELEPYGVYVTPGDPPWEANYRFAFIVPGDVRATEEEK